MCGAMCGAMFLAGVLAEPASMMTTSVSIPGGGTLKIPPRCAVTTWKDASSVLTMSHYPGGTSTAGVIPLNPTLIFGNYLKPTMVGECTTSDNSGTWRTARIGPFVSTGGYDWWKFEKWEQLLSFTGEHLIDGIFYAAVDAEAHPILHPPLHSHHTHVVTADTDARMRVLSEQHGDWLPHPSDCMPDCSGIEDLRPNFFKIDGPLHGQAMMNDVRPASSAPMEWYFEASMHTLSKADQAGKTLSKHYMWSPMAMAKGYQRLSAFETFDIPMSGDTFMVYGGKMPFTGSTVHINFHAHMVGFQEGYLFNLATDAIAPSLESQYSHTPATLGFASNKEVAKHMLRNAPQPPVCTASGRRVNISGVLFDRHAHMRCGEWRFAQGDPFTSVSFNGPPRPDESREGNEQQHAHWWVTYTADDGQMSRFTTGYDEVVTAVIQELKEMPSSTPAVMEDPGAQRLFSSHWREGELQPLLVAGAIGIMLTFFVRAAQRRRGHTLL